MDGGGNPRNRLSSLEIKLGEHETRTKPHCNGAASVQTKQGPAESGNGPHVYQISIASRWHSTERFCGGGGRPRIDRLDATFRRDFCGWLLFKAIAVCHGVSANDVR